MFEVESPVQPLTASDWQVPQVHPRLGRHEVHVWRAALDLAPARVARLYRILNSDEQRRVARFYFERDRDRFVVARANLRVLLGRYLGQDPAQLDLTYDAHGKPALVQNPSLTFNLSHSDGLALYAVTRDGDLGIDIERVRADFPYAELAEQYFSPGERVRLCELPPFQRLIAFFRIWTRKEAYLKARGEGLVLPLDKFDATCAFEGRTLHDLHLGARYVGALAGQGEMQLSYWQFTP